MEILTVIPLILGVFFICIGAFHGWKLRGTVRRCTVHADGTLIGFHEIKTRSGIMYYPVVEFVAGTVKHKAEYKFGASEWDLAAGDKVALRYNRDDPDEIYLYHSLPLWKQYFSPFCVIAGGIIFICTYYFYF